MPTGIVLIVDDEEKLRTLLARIIRLEGFVVFEAENLKTAGRLLEKEEVDVILCDVKLPDGNGVDFVAELRTRHPAVESILLTAYGNIADGVKAMKNGAFDYIIKGDDNDKIIPLLSRAFEKVQLQKRITQLERQVGQRYTFANILGQTPQITEAIALAKKVAPTDANVLLLGETGTGKEVFAQAIHHGSKRAAKPFMALNCSAFGKELLESELFGHKAGAFTGANKDKRGLIEEADLGTLFLDEIGEMHVDLQAKLLRVLEGNEFIKVGDTRPTRVNVRVIAATNRDLQQEVDLGKFREDLFYRLNVFTISLPPLRNRKKDIPVIAAYYLPFFAVKSNKRVEGMTPGFLEQLQLHEWKGNIRELKNIIERAVILAEGPELTVENLPAEFQASSFRTSGPLSAFDMASMEKLHIQRVLNHTKGNKTEAARLLNIGLTTLYRKIEEYRLVPET
ncbi:MAG: sigma-54 dependent transcriptional regulator [Bacteroidota bacterium]|nr:sigma-54 dependent transcriptional regulator [Bacteroidota bacterium]MDP4216335.1 sigma-54 dependent transcriptional regulator [Bacteroidota bacterium]MDP4256226.1 sigma-54 dependent transcriptional regulator [Bacteroidota bacterium]MDP4257186.1 sigma-54 dependent transcriptional regulator [Bacteroidota bacterium]